MIYHISLMLLYCNIKAFVLTTHIKKVVHAAPWSKGEDTALSRPGYWVQVPSGSLLRYIQQSLLSRIFIDEEKGLGSNPSR